MPNDFPPMEPPLVNLIDFLMEDARKDLREKGEVPPIAYLIHHNPSGAKQSANLKGIGLDTRTEERKDASAKRLIAAARAMKAHIIVTVFEIWAVMKKDGNAVGRPSQDPERVEMVAIHVEQPGVFRSGYAQIVTVKGVKTLGKLIWQESVPPEQCTGRFANLLDVNAARAAAKERHP